MDNKTGYNPVIHHRKSIRLKGYDYSQNGLYFITICTYNRECLFAEIIDKKMILNDAGKIANECWQKIPEHFPDAVLHEHFVMPNHVHGIIELAGATVAGNENAGIQNVWGQTVAGANRRDSKFRIPTATPTTTITAKSISTYNTTVNRVNCSGI